MSASSPTRKRKRSPVEQDAGLSTTREGPGDDSRSKISLRRMVQGEGVDGEADPKTKYIALDCEMVGVEPTGASSLARVSIVDYDGRVLLDRFVKQSKEVLYYRTKWSGIRAKDLVHAPSFKDVQKEVVQIMKDRIVIGHALHHDLRMLQVTYPSKYTRDTQTYRPLSAQGVGRSLKRLIKELLGIDIQDREHDSVVDARATLALFKYHQIEWEAGLPESHFISTTSSEELSNISASADLPSSMPPDDSSNDARMKAKTPKQTQLAFAAAQTSPRTLLDGLTIYIVPAKLNLEALADLQDAVAAHGAILTNLPRTADLILTDVGAKKRLERHLNLSARNGAILRLDWLRDSIKASRRLPFSSYLVTDGATVSTGS